ncbi:hypothetical protein OG500_08480 [Kitasatospora sp. NBC_01250]|uniref:hypothetical protein n=1 Tax=unclassified Kitasatospora TaxID=2633591 RepID=UPI002E15FF26|nr:MULTISPECIES: hypothetical protein [unclassified Kitasatospora]WSJ66139.1 hypothetical protein OG294_08465 [Kitasatospora sp. NBC_01302]
MKTLRILAQQFLLPLLLPVTFGAALLRIHGGRAKAARAEGDRGALSIEMALIVIVVVAIAGAVLAAVSSFGNTVKKTVPTTLPTGIPTQ